MTWVMRTNTWHCPSRKRQSQNLREKYESRDGHNILFDLQSDDIQQTCCRTRRRGGCSVQRLSIAYCVGCISKAALFRQQHIDISIGAPRGPAEKSRIYEFDFPGRTAQDRGPQRVLSASKQLSKIDQQTLRSAAGFVLQPPKCCAIS